VCFFLARYLASPWSAWAGRPAAGERRLNVRVLPALKGRQETGSAAQTSTPWPSGCGCCSRRSSTAARRVPRAALAARAAATRTSLARREDGGVERHLARIEREAQRSKLSSRAPGSRPPGASRARARAGDRRCRELLRTIVADVAIERMRRGVWCNCSAGSAAGVGEEELLRSASRT